MDEFGFIDEFGGDATVESGDWDWGNLDSEFGGDGGYNFGMAALGGAGSLIRSIGGGSVGGGATGAAVGGGMAAAAGAGLVSLGSKLAGMFGRISGSFVINGVKGSMSALWPAVRKYGPAAVATALGISAAALADLLMHAPTSKKRRARGISARDLRTSRRTIRTVKRFSSMLGLGRRGRGHYHRGGGQAARYYR